MENIFCALVHLSLTLLFFEVGAISRSLLRLEKTQKKISEDLQIFINKYFNVNK